MLKAIILFAALLIVFSSSAQNIVVNPDLEQYISCPNNVSQMNNCVGWQNAGLGTADYFNACATYAVSVPLNVLGYQLSASGVGYAGLYVFYALIQNYREYIRGPLANMQAGQYYQVSIKVSLSDLQKYAVDGLGILFTYDSTYMLSSNTVQPFIPQIDFPVAGPITDTTNWITLTDTFYADSAYRHFVIGGFKPDSLLAIDTLAVGVANSSYYYIDDVSVTPLFLGIEDDETMGDLPTISPHPVTSLSVVRFNNPMKESFTFSLYNVQGQLIEHLSGISSGEFTISRNTLPPGLFFYHLGNNNRRYVGKLVVE